MIDNEPTSKVRILIVEDNPGDVELIRMALCHAGLDSEITVIDDGERALAFFQQQQNWTNGQPPDLVLLDLNLPKSGGLEILEAMRANPSFAAAKVAVLSSSSSSRDRTKIASFNVDLTS